MTSSILSTVSAKGARNIRPRAPFWLTVLALVVGAPLASATTITYSFTGATLGSLQEDNSFTYDLATGLTRSPTYGSTEDASTGSVSFNLDLDLYVDQDPLVGHAYFFEEPPFAPWLTSTSTMSGPLFTRTLTTFGAVSSGLWGVTREASEYGEGFLNLFDLLRSRYEVVEDDLGREISSRYQRVFNSMALRGDVRLGVVDGKEVPISVGALTDGFIEQWQDEWVTEYSYDDLGTQTHVSTVATYLRTVLPIQSWDISINSVPEPTSLLLLGAGLVALGLSRGKTAARMEQRSCRMRVRNWP